MSAKSLALLSATALLAGPRCLSSYGINESLARRGLYPLANVGGDPYGRYIYMRVARGNEQFVVTVDGCTGQVMR